MKSIELLKMIAKQTSLPIEVGNVETQIWFSGRSGGRSPSSDKFDPIKNEGGCPKKPAGGLWTSTFKLNEYISDWHEQGGEMFGDLGDAWLMQPSDDVKYYVVDDVKDLERLWETYHYVVKDLLKFDFYDKTLSQPLDFEGLFYDYDAIILTEEGQWRTRLSNPLNLYGWDSECVLWGKWKFTYVEKLIKVK